MLAKIAPPTNDFAEVARYLVHGRPGAPQNRRRVAWVMAQNLPTDDPALAAIYMQATAQLSARTRKPAYHLMIAWHAQERPTREAMQEVAKQTLLLAGLAEHQALIMGHGDKPHPHLHILLNRVHPYTGRAWKTAHDFARFDDIIRQLAEAYGFAHVPAHTYNPEPTDDREKLPNSRATYAAKRGARTSRPQWSRRISLTFGAELSEDLTLASTTDDVVQLLADRGLRVEAKGKGFVVGDDDTYAKLSSLPLTCSARSRELLRFAATPRQHTQPLFEVDAVDIVRALHTVGLISREDVRAAIDDASHQRNARRRASASTFLSPMLAAARPATGRLKPYARLTSTSFRGLVQRR